jgi:hypothetical protein
MKRDILLLDKEEEKKLLYNEYCHWCGAQITYKDNVRSDKTNNRLSLNLDESLHSCAVMNWRREQQQEKKG